MRARAVPVVVALVAATLLPAGPGDASTDAAPWDRVLVWFAPGTDVTEVLDGHAVEATSDDRDLGFVTVGAAPGRAEVLAAALADDPAVVGAVADVPVVAARTPTDPRWPSQWGPRQIRANRAWDVTLGRSRPIVAVLDSGVDPHDDLPPSALVRGYNVVSGGDDVRDDHPDRHGTAVATVIAGRGDNGIGGAGYCWQCRIMPVKVLDDQGRGGIPEVIEGIRYAADNGARVINLSLGTRPGYALPVELVDALESAVAHAERRGAIVVAAAGNHGTGERTYPAALSKVVGVAAHAESGSLAAYSGRGSWLDVAAPGCHEIRPVARSEFCGTSAAAPAVSGVLALLRDVDRTASPADHRRLLHGTSRAVDGVRYGLVDAGAAVDRVIPAEALRDAIALAGDWNGDGRQTPGWFRDGRFHLRMHNDGGPPDVSFTYGRKGDLPLVGDWDGDGRDTVGIVRGGEWHLRNGQRGGQADVRFVYGRVDAGDVPLVGDWNGDGRDTVGILRGGEWHLRNQLAGGVADHRFVYGRVARGDVPLTGDWNGDGRDTVGIVRDGGWHLRASLSGGPADHVFVYGRVADGDQATVGDWTGDGVSTPAIARAQTWHLRHRVASGPADRVFRFYGY